MEFYHAALQTCRACRLETGEKVVVFSDSQKNPVLADAFYAAADSLGGEVVAVYVNAQKAPLVDPPAAAVAAMTEADLVFDMATQPWLYTASTRKILEGGARMLQFLVSDESIIARYPTPEISERCARLAARLQGEVVHIASDLGTDLTVRRGGRPVHYQDGAVTFPGDWDSLGVVVCAFAPVESEADGVVVVNGPVYAGPDLCYHVNTPFEMVFEGGRVVDIRGEGGDAARLRAYLEAVGDPNAYVIAHAGYGMDPRAGIQGVVDIGNWESYDGGINIAIGSNNIPQLQGRTACKSHVDAFVLGADMTVDGRPVIRNGRFVD
jgi:2,5-dihydroxypyridine 5,6-dioxygenase